jgi:hypothetical protein
VLRNRNLFLCLKDEVSSVLVEEYRTRLRKLVTSVGDYRVRRALPAAWSAAGMHHFKISVESEASSLMLSPGGRTDPLEKITKFVRF